MDNLYKIKFFDNSFLECIAQPLSVKRMFRGQDRDCILIKFNNVSYEVLNEIFIDGLNFSIMAYEEISNVSGLPSREYEYVEYPKTDYIVAGDIIDHRDGTFTALMGKKTALELLEEENAALLFENLTGEEF